MTPDFIILNEFVDYLVEGSRSSWGFWPIDERIKEEKKWKRRTKQVFIRVTDISAFSESPNDRLDKEDGQIWTRIILSSGKEIDVIENPEQVDLCIQTIIKYYGRQRNE